MVVIIRVGSGVAWIAKQHLICDADCGVNRQGEAAKEQQAGCDAESAIRGL
jgi:hypothetical protein